MHPEYTVEQWEQLSPALRSLPIGTVEAAYAILVEGRRPLELVDDFGPSLQAVQAAAKQVREIFNENRSEGQSLVPVMVWLPPELAEQIKSMAEPYEALLLGKQQAAAAIHG
ncbi:TrfB-related DNA-binding protein [Azomonas macrocytogenes]|uniref:TrfB transcriptional repressor protein domain-containing protein n=1 Tax=Azomonas macrocytogenes TaxID=69962 RepID=A0A839T3P8_AZOMA|nr:TrfB-related DNA-binding protein [Azomonas macrocytogenes]MBB3104161.1 hypothetical protein [Azomonas macrocytogenes]